MTDAGTIRNELKSNHGLDDPDVISWPTRRRYYVVGKEADDLPSIEGFEPLTDPSLSP